MSARRLRVGISACLLGQEVRYDGQHKRDDLLVDVLGRCVEWVPVCPEVELGLGVPREPIRLVGRSGAPRLLAERSGADHTDAMRAYARRRVAALAREDLSGYVTKKDSPSCGMARVRVHPARGGPPRRDGVGAFARELLAAMPLLPVAEEADLHDPALRESFTERVFAYARWKALVERGVTRRGLVAFHAAHELLLLAHSAAAYRRLGALVGELGKSSARAAARQYGEGFMRALAVPATRVRHATVLRRVLGDLRGVLEPVEQEELEEIASDYARGLVPLAVPLTLVRHHVRRHGVERLAGQVYLEPDAEELMPRSHA
jgi:uncharacterized protein YbbK (DUF523 family)/uncharacterized protein YbgA (DUF1722 family)